MLHVYSVWRKEEVIGWVGGGKSGVTPPPCFLQEYDSMGVNRWGCAKDVILWELGKKQIKVDPSAALWASSLKLKRERFGQLNAPTRPG